MNKWINTKTNKCLLNAYTCVRYSKINEYFIFYRIDCLKSEILESFILTLFLHTQNTGLGDILYTHYFLTLNGMSLSQICMVTSSDHKWENSGNNVSSFPLTSGISLAYCTHLKPYMSVPGIVNSQKHLLNQIMLDKIHRPFSL